MTGVHPFELASSQIDGKDGHDAMRAQHALDRLAELHPKLIDLGLDRTFALLDRLGNPHHRVPPTIHVSGTNGKGSVIAHMRAMAEGCGLRVHVYSSPHLCRFNERIRLAGKLIGDGELADLLEDVEAVNGTNEVTFFEVTTAAAMLAFSRVDADLLLLETGLGGALDSTNVLDRPLATIITPVARDHEHFLGTDLATIASQKAGIMRNNVPCFSAQQDKVVADEIATHASNLGAQLFISGTDFDGHQTADGRINLAYSNSDLLDSEITLPKPSLPGAHQIDNANLAAAALIQALGSSYNLTPDMIVAGLGNAIWPGRIQKLNKGDLTTYMDAQSIWLDGAHNAHGAKALVAALPEIHEGQWTVICGALNTRDPVEFLAPISNIAGQIYTLTIPDQPASLTADELANAATAMGLAASPASSIQTALMKADNNQPVIICGSLYLAGYILAQNKTLPV
ncbi:Mur ligase family protein [Alphaproteobacteria bacterium]|nr:Mur ligase family protein [Alphaproteobacteria bacterium]